MNSQTSTCDPGRLEAFLNGDLGAAQECEFTLHLNTCEDCRRSLERQAAEPTAWIEAEQLLKPARFDADQASEDADSEVSQRSVRQPLQIQNVLDALGPTDYPEMLGRLGGYEVSAVVGAGGMGVVLKAIDKSLDRTVAIKVLAPHLASSGAARKRFAHEAKAAAAVLHPNVIAIHSVSNDEVLPYLVMPYVRGTSLQKRLDNEGPLTLNEILRIGSQIAAGLAAAHAQGLVHRDIKPANILLEQGVERVTITDFGLARAVDDATITHSGMIAGTPQYMSPEQARGEAVDQRSDLFSLGSVLYAICTGRPPFRAETTYGVMRRITDDEPTAIREINADIPDWLCAIIARLMSKRAVDRFGSASEVTELLEQFLAHVQQPASVPLPASLQKSVVRRGGWSVSKRLKGVLAMIGALGVTLLGLLFFTEPSDIAGEWSGEEWGHVTLKKTNDSEYTGTYTDTWGNQPGEIQLKWSRIERQFVGTWREGDDRFGDLSVRLVGDEIRGAHTTDTKSKINPATPRLAGLFWTKANAAAAVDVADSHDVAVLRGAPPPLILARPIAETNRTFGPDREGVLPYGAPCQQQYFQFRSGKVFSVGHGPATSREEFKEDRKHMDEAGGADISLGSSDGIQLLGEGCIFTNDVANLKWNTFTAAEVVEAMRRVNFSFGVMEPKVSDLPMTYLFKTSRGDVGIMELLKIVDDERGAGKKGRGLKFRYKLVQQDEQHRTLVPARLPEPRYKMIGTVVDVRQQELCEVSVGLEEGLRVGDMLDVFRGSNFVARIEVLDLNADKSVCRIRSRNGNVRPDDQVVKADLPEVKNAIPYKTHLWSFGSAIHTIACSADGKLIAIINSSTPFPLNDDWNPSVDILDAETGKTVRALQVISKEDKTLLIETEGLPQFEMGPVAFSPDGKLVAVGTGLGQVKLFDPQTGELIRSLDDEPAKLAEKQTPEKLKTLKRAMGGVGALAFSPDGSLLAMCGSSFEDAARNWGGVRRLGRLGTGPGRLKVWDAKTGALKQDLVGHSHATGIAFSPDGKLLASAGRWEDGRNHGDGVIIWDPQTGTKTRVLSIATNGGIRSVAISPDGKFVAVGSQHFDKDKDHDASTGTITLIRLGSGIVEWQQSVPVSANPLAFSPDGKSVVAMCGRSAIRFLDTDTGSVKHEFSNCGVLNTFVIAPRANRLVVGGADKDRNGTVEARDLGGIGSVIMAR